MIRCLKLTISYIRYYKKQTFVLFSGILMSVILLTGIASLMYSGRAADREFAREQYGDWHFQIVLDKEEEFTSFDKSMKTVEKVGENQKKSQIEKAGVGYQIEKLGRASAIKRIKEPFEISFYSADKNYMAMTGRTLLEGSYPKKTGEIALDYYTIHNLELSGNIGDKVTLEEESYILCGILSDIQSEESKEMQAYLCREEAFDSEENVLCLKFDESSRVYPQLESFLQAYGLKDEKFMGNDELNAYVGGEKKKSLPEIIKAAIQLPEGRLVYFWGSLNESFDFTNKMVLFALALFGVFVIYSLFQISVVKRFRQYAILRTLGLEECHIFICLLMELFLIFAVSYPMGCVFGNGIGKLLYGKLGLLFQASEVVKGEQNLFYIAWDVIFFGAFFFLFVFLFLCIAVTGRLRKYSEAVIMKNQCSFIGRSRKIYSRGKRKLTNLLTSRFMFGRMAAFLGMVISLSLGGVIFLTTSYVTGSTRADNAHKRQTDDNLGDDIQVSIDSDDLHYSIPDSVAEQIEKVPGIHSSSPVSYLLGEMPLQNGILKWTAYFPELSGQKDYTPDPEIMEKYNGIITKQSEDDYRLKVNVYGYTDDMLEELKSYVLEGRVDAAWLKKKNSILLKTLMDGQGNYDGIDLHVGDTITLKVPKLQSVSGEILRFNSKKENYIEKEFIIAGLVSRPIGKNTCFIGDNGTDRVDIIMSNEQMQDNFGVSDYNSVALQLEKGADSVLVTKHIKALVTGVGKCLVKDYTTAIAEQNKHLRQQEIFFYGIAVIILGISLMHIMNSMQYLVLSRMHEWGILRAMGITDAGLRKMLVWEGIRYGVCVSIVMFLLYGLVYRVVTWIMKHVFLYIITDAMLMPWLCVSMISLNIVLCIVAVLYAGREVLREEICGLIKK